MRTSHLVSLSFALLSAASVSALAQAPAVGAGQSVQGAPVSDGAVNPMTGRSLSEEDLMRQLSKAKLQTQIGQEQVKQAQNSADWALATLRHEAEKARLRNETLALTKSAVAATQVPKPQKPSALVNSMDARNALVVTDAEPMMSPKVAMGPASGSISFGGEVVNVESLPRTTSSKVDWVDAQVRPKQTPGAPLQPLNVQPAVGMLGVPPIPGLQANSPSR